MSLFILNRAEVKDGKKDDYHSILSKAKRLDKATCEREGIVFGSGDTPTVSNASETLETDQEKTTAAQSEENLRNDAVNKEKATQRNQTAIPMPDKDMSYHVKEGPPPLTDDPESVELVTAIIDDIIDVTLYSVNDQTTHKGLTDSDTQQDGSNESSSDDTSQTTHSDTHSDSRVTPAIRLPGAPADDRRESSVSSITTTGSVSSHASLVNDAKLVRTCTIISLVYLMLLGNGAHVLILSPSYFV